MHSIYLCINKYMIYTVATFNSCSLTAAASVLAARVSDFLALRKTEVDVV